MEEPIVQVVYESVVQATREADDEAFPDISDLLLEIRQTIFMDLLMPSLNTLVLSSMKF